MSESAFTVRPVTLTNRWVTLEPLRPTHAPDLFHTGHSHPDLEFQPTPPFTTTMDGVNWVTNALNDKLAGQRVPFAIMDKSAQAAVGSTSLFDIRPAERALEIGYTWLTPTVHRTPLKTDARNTVSQRAIERPGATREGILRRHMKLHDGFVRDTVFYSILPEEWPDIKNRLTSRLEA